MVFHSGSSDESTEECSQDEESSCDDLSSEDEREEDDQYQSLPFRYKVIFSLMNIKNHLGLLFGPLSLSPKCHVHVVSLFPCRTAVF